MATRASILTIGDELLSGDIVDKNKATLAAWCRAQGLTVVGARTVRDREEEIVDGIRWACAVGEICLTSGGLGPTTDDLTIASVAVAGGLGLLRHAPSEQRIRDIFAVLGRNLTDMNLKQADLPEGADVLDNPIGTAPGVAVTVATDVGSCLVCCMPGVPRELRKMVAEQVEPIVRARFEPSPVHRRVYRCLGKGESTVQQHITELIDRARSSSPSLANVMVHYRAHMPEVLVNLEGLAHDGVAGATNEELATLDGPMAEVLGRSLYGIGERELPERFVRALEAASLTFATAESCTGGLCGGLVTDVAGSSAVFLGGVIAYANAVKIRDLGVAQAAIAQHGAVSEVVARAMAEGARDRFGSDLAVGITGIAGPGGGTPEKPRGTVDLAVADQDGTSYKRLRLYGNRGTVRRAAALWALKLAWDRMVARGLASVEDQP